MQILTRAATAESLEFPSGITRSQTLVLSCILLEVTAELGTSDTVNVEIRMEENGAAYVVLRDLSEAAQTAVSLAHIETGRWLTPSHRRFYFRISSCGNPSDPRSPGRLPAFNVPQRRPKGPSRHHFKA